MVSGVGIQKQQQHGCRVEHPTLTLRQQGIPKRSPIVPERQSPSRELLTDELFLRQEIGISVTTDQSTAIKQRTPAKEHADGTDQNSQQPVFPANPGIKSRRAQETSLLRSSWSGHISIKDPNLGPTVPV